MLKLYKDRVRGDGDWMKNKFIFKCLLFVAICLFSISMNSTIVKAVDKFPELIYVGSTKLIRYDGGGNIFKKDYSLTKNGPVEGKAYCSSFWASAPGENSKNRIQCTKEGWPNNRYAAAIGAIVNAARSSDGSTTWYNYYYAELAINRFLYKHIEPKNNIYNYAPYSIINSSKFKGYYNKAQAAYAEYNAQSNLKIEVGKPKFSKEKEKEKEVYKITSTISCKVGSEKVECPKDMAVTIKISNKSYKVSTTKNDKTLTVSAKVTNLKAGKYTATVSASSTKNFVLAQRYSCGNKQKMVPNLLKPVKITKSDKDLGIFEIPELEIPTCEKELKEGETLTELYEKYNETGLLNINSPSCDDVNDNSSDFACSESFITRSEVKTLSNRYLYCTYKYQVNSPIFEGASATEQSLIYKISQTMAQDNKVESNLNVDISILCNAIPVSEAKIKDTNIKSLTIGLKSLLPAITVDIFGTSYSAIPQIKDSNLSVSSNLKINKKDANDIEYKFVYQDNTNQQFSILGRINYTFDDYKIDRSSNTIVKTSECNDNDSCKLKGIDIGNGIPVPVGSNSGKSTIHINVAGEEGRAECEYTINKLGGKEQLLFRTIDTNNPFLNKDGGLRYTGTNWCKSEDSQDTDEIVENIGNDISTNIFNKTGRLLGDVNGSATDLTIKNGAPAITYYDVVLIRAYAKNMDFLDPLTADEKNDIKLYGDINQDGSITEDDANLLFQELTNYFITSDAALSGYGNRTDDVVNAYVQGDFGIDENEKKIWWKKDKKNSLNSFLYDYSGGNVAVVDKIVQDYTCDIICKDDTCYEKCKFNDDSRDKYFYDIMKYMISTYTYPNSLGKTQPTYLSCRSTNSNGNDCYSNHTYNLKNIAGDINGDHNVDDKDVEMIQWYLADTVSLTESQKELADVDGDGKISIYDVTALQKRNYTFQKGDVNLDGKVDQNDFDLLNSYIFSSNANNEIDSYTLVNADIDENGIVNIYDLVRFRDYFIASAYDFNEIYSGGDSSNEVGARKYNQSYCNAWTTKNKNNNDVSINSTVEKYITNRPNSDGKKNSFSNDKAEPLYSFTLTPDNIKEIRKYNKGRSYDDFELTCTNNECISTFVNLMFTNKEYAVDSSGQCEDKSINEQFCNVSALLSS